MQGLNHVKAVLDKGDRALGVWQLLPGSNMSRTLARAGYDWVLVDCEHGNIDGQEFRSYLEFNSNIPRRRRNARSCPRYNVIWSEPNCSCSRFPILDD